MTRCAAVLFAVVVFAGATRIAAQNDATQAPAGAPPDRLPTFEVASVKVNKSGEMGASIRRQPGGRLNAVNMPLRDLVQFAFQVRPFQIEGVPGWAVTTRYDIVAKAAEDIPPTMPGGAPAPEMLMLRSLLAERFKLVARMETREMPIYALTLARSDGKFGPKFGLAQTDCQAMMKAAAGRGGAPPPPLPGPAERVQCGIRIGPGRLNAGGMPLSEFANALSVLVQRTVVDRSGLAGNYDAEVTFRPELGGPQPPPGGVAPQIDPDAPSLFTALQEQLGLKLESTRGPVPMLVVERLEPAVED